MNPDMTLHTQVIITTHKQIKNTRSCGEHQSLLAEYSSVGGEHRKIQKLTRHNNNIIVVIPKVCIQHS